MSLELNRKILEMKRVQMAQEEMEFNILEREADIQRLRNNIENQKKRAEELRKEIKIMEEKING